MTQALALVPAASTFDPDRLQTGARRTGLPVPQGPRDLTLIGNRSAVALSAERVQAELGRDKPIAIVDVKERADALRSTYFPAEFAAPILGTLIQFQTAFRQHAHLGSLKNSADALPSAREDWRNARTQAVATGSLGAFFDALAMAGAAASVTASAGLGSLFAYTLIRAAIGVVVNLDTRDQVKRADALLEQGARFVTPDEASQRKYPEGGVAEGFAKIYELQRELTRIAPSAKVDFSTDEGPFIVVTASAGTDFEALQKAVPADAAGARRIGGIPAILVRASDNADG